MAHTHDVYDMENHFEINGSSRFIKETSETKLVVVQGDHKSEVLTFKMPRYIDGHDMTLCNKIRIHYINLDTKTNNKSADVYEVTDLTLCEECEDVLTFTWTIEAPATKYSGTLSFLVKFECTEGENVLYQWNTAKYVSVNVLAGIDNSEEFVEKYSNVLEEWYNELTKGADSIEELNQQAIAEIELAKEDAKEDIQGKADATMDGIPDDYLELDGHVKEIMNSDLCTKKEYVQSLNLEIGSYASPKSELNTTLSYNASVKIDLKQGDVLKFTESGYSVKYALITDVSFPSWTSEDVLIETSGTYAVSVRKDNSYNDLTSDLEHVNTIFGLSKVEYIYGIKDNYVTKQMIDWSTFENDFIDVVKDANIDNTGATDVTTQIQSLLNIGNDNGFVFLYFPKGTYLVTNQLNYYNRTKLLFAKGSTINYNKKSGVILSNLLVASQGNNYNLGSLEIEGATITRPFASEDTNAQTCIGLQCCQLELLSIKNCHFVDCSAGNHLIDISGCKEVIIENNIFEGMHLPSTIRPTKEANYSYDTEDGVTIHTDLEMIQIDHGKGLSTQSMADDPTMNVRIYGNVFMPNEENANSVIYRPIGIHSVSTIGMYRNIAISCNTFKDAIGRVISLTNANGVDIKNNLFTNDKETVFSDLVRITLMIFGKHYDSKDISVIGNEVDYSVDNNGFKFFTACMSDGNAKARNVELKWNETGSFGIDTTNCENVSS